MTGDAFFFVVAGGLLFWICDHSPFARWLIEFLALSFAFLCWPAIFVLASVLIYIPREQYWTMFFAFILIAPFAVLFCVPVWPHLRECVAGARRRMVFWQ